VSRGLRVSAGRDGVDLMIEHDERTSIRLKQNAVFSDMFTEALSAYYQHHPTGGPLHITTDDYNCSDSHLKFCRTHAETEGDIAGLTLISMLERIGADCREGLIREVHLGWPGHNKDSDHAVNFRCWRCRDHCPQPGPFKFYSMVTCATYDVTSLMYNVEEMFYD